MSENPKYDTAVQLYNLERDGGKNYSLKDIEKKFFAIDEKTSREAAKTRIAQGNVAMGHRGEHILTDHGTRETLNGMAIGKLRTPMQPLTPTAMQIPLATTVAKRDTLSPTAPIRRMGKVTAINQLREM